MFFRPNRAEHEAHLLSACVATRFSFPIAAAIRAADVGCHAPPRGVRMLHSFSSAAIARTLVNPWDRRSSTMAICVRLDRSHGLHVADLLTPEGSCPIHQKNIKAGTKSTLHVCYLGWVGVYLLSTRSVSDAQPRRSHLMPVYESIGKVVGSIE